MEQQRSQGAAAGPDLFTAIGRHLILFLLPILVLAGTGVAYGLLRDPHYKAEARVSIGSLNISTQGLPGFTSAATNLAAAYARTIDAAAIVDPAAQAAEIPSGRARDDLDASAIPETPLLRVEASDADAKVALTLANKAADALIAHVLDLNRRANLRDDVLYKYKRAAAKVATLQRQIAVVGPKAPAVEDLNGRLQTAILRRDALGTIYNVAAAGEISENLLQVVAPAAEAESDRDTTVQRFGLIGGLAGLLIGLVLAAARESRQQRRQLGDDG
ncbi:MAG: hypothetical protein ACJ762_14590 [Solirubrobacteraceae bacterium]